MFKVIASSAVLTIVGWQAQAVVINTVLVDNPGNLPDPVVMGDGTSGYGDVAYPYRMGMHEVTNAEYAEFLNAVADADPNQLYSASMGTSFNGGITQTVGPSGYVYAPKAGFANKPVNFVSFFDCARFCNWLHNGQPVGPQGPATTETGAYTMLGINLIDDGDVDGHGRNSGWLWAIPTEDEWHKAAFNGAGNTWYSYATQSNTAPAAVAPPGGTNSANYSGAVPLLTVAGAYPQSVSYWGTFQQNGNLSEWNEGSVWIGSLTRRIRGGNFDQGSNSLSSDMRGGASNGAIETNGIGFRVVQAVIITGACCLVDGTCVGDQSLGECLAQQGKYQGNGTTCASVTCDTNLGACCYVDGTCVEGITADQCAKSGGLYKGDASTCSGAGCAPVGPVVFVDAARPPGGNGTSWKSAWNDLQDALDQAHAFPAAVQQIWVVAAVYTPDRGTNDRALSFELADGVGLYGGFNGTETDLSQRDPVTNVTVLSGDLDGNDVYNFSSSNFSFDDNSYHVLTATNLSAASIVDGFTIIGGNASFLTIEDQGGGLLAENSSAVLQGCKFSWNRAHDGGAVVNLGGSPVFTGCSFDHNGMWNRGGAMLNIQSDPQIVDCLFTANESLWVTALATAMYNEASSPSVTNTAFTNNFGASAVEIRDGGEPSFNLCLFENNSGRHGGAVRSISSAPSFTSCDFINNATTWFAGDGGAAHISGAATFEICTFSGNAAGVNGGAMLAAGSLDGVATITSCVFTDNSAQDNGGAVANGAAFPTTYTNCQFEGNTAKGLGGAVYNQGFALPVFVGCAFTNNSSQQAGGALYHFNDGTVTLEDCTFSGNAAPMGDGVFNRRGGLAGNAILAGDDGILNGMNMNILQLEPPSNIGTFTVGGNYRHAILGETGDQLPVLFIDIAGYAAGTSYDQLAVSGNVQIDGGGLVISFSNGFVPIIGDEFVIITGGSIFGEFELVGMTGAPIGIGVELFYEPNAIRATVVETDPPPFTVSPNVGFNGTPLSVTTLDANLDGFADVALTTAGEMPNSLGYALLFLNAGTDKNGNWLGLIGPPLATQVGMNPTSIDQGLLDGDAYPDLVVGNQMDSTVSVLRNLDGNGFALIQQLGVGGEAIAASVGQLVDSALPDIAVVNKSQSKVRVLQNLGNMSFTLFADVSTDPDPTWLALEDLDLDDDLDFVVTTSSEFFNPPSLLTPFHFAASLFTAEEGEIVGRRPTKAIAATLDGNTMPDVVTANRLDQSLSVLLNNPAALGTFLPSTTLPLEAEPCDMTAIDLEADNDLDLVVVVITGPGTSALRTLTNFQLPNGVQFEVNELPTDERPVVVTAADMDNDGDTDLIVLNDDALGIAGAGGSIQVFLNEGQPVVVGDITGDGVVDVSDLLAVISGWGPCPPACPADLDDDGVVAVTDLLIVISNWS